MFDWQPPRRIASHSETRQDRGLEVVWVLVSHCAYEVTPLAPIQAALPPETPLDDMSEPKKKAALKSPLLDVGQQPLQGGPVQIGAATAAIIIMPGQHGPAFLPLAEYVGFRACPLRIQRVELLAQALLGGLAGIDGATHRAGHAGRVAPFLRCSVATTWAVLLPGRAAVMTGAAAAAFLAGGAFLAGVALWAALPLTGASWAACAPPLAWRAAFGWARFAGGRTGSARA